MTGLLFTGGEGPTRDRIEHLLSSDPYIAASDSGLELARSMGVDPEVIAGDMDSLSDRSILDEYPRERVILFPEDKDETDTEIGLRLLREAGCDRIVIVGGGGGRLDHSLAIVALFERPHRPDEWYTRQERILVVDDELMLDGMNGRRISFFPLGCETAKMTSEGLVWPLDTLSWKRGDAGISNRGAHDRVRVRMLHGRLLALVSLEEGTAE